MGQHTTPEARAELYRLVYGPLHAVREASEREERIRRLTADIERREAALQRQLEDEALLERCEGDKELLAKVRQTISAENITAWYQNEGSTQ